MSVAPLQGDLFCGDLVRLAQDGTEALAAEWTRWSRDSLYYRLVNDTTHPQFSAAWTQAFFENESGPGAERYFFTLRTLADERLIGFVELETIHWTHGEAWIALGIGDRQDWNRGYGSDALRLVLRYAFDELGLHRVSLDVFAYNHRAQRVYEKAGFHCEGRERGVIHRAGEHHDVLVMAVLRDEWTARTSQAVR